MTNDPYAEARRVMLDRRQLRAMRERWQRDLDRLEAAFPGLELGEEFTSETETIRNLATAIAHIDGIITNVTPLSKRFPKDATHDQ
jgi:hypothetical protein